MKWWYIYNLKYLKFASFVVVVLLASLSIGESTSASEKEICCILYVLQKDQFSANSELQVRDYST